MTKTVRRASAKILKLTQASSSKYSITLIPAAPTSVRPSLMRSLYSHRLPGSSAPPSAFESRSCWRKSSASLYSNTPSKIISTVALSHISPASTTDALHIAPALLPISETIVLKQRDNGYVGGILALCLIVLSMIINISLRKRKKSIGTRPIR